MGFEVHKHGGVVLHWKCLELEGKNVEGWGDLDYGKGGIWDWAFLCIGRLHDVDSNRH